MIACSLSEGRRNALPLVLGVGLGNLIAASVVLVGLGNLVAVSATAFTVVKAIGALYVAWVGIKMFRTEPVLSTVDAASASSGLTALREGCLVTVSIPKGILFFIALVPQFIRADASYLGQATFFRLTITYLGIVNGAAYAFGADAMRRVIVSTGVLR